MASHHTTSNSREGQTSSNGSPGDPQGGSLHPQYSAEIAAGTSAQDLEGAPSVSPHPVNDTDQFPWSNEEHVMLGCAFDWLSSQMPYLSARELIERLHLLYVVNEIAPGREGREKTDSNPNGSKDLTSTEKSQSLTKIAGEHAIHTKRQFPNFVDGVHNLDSLGRSSEDQHTSRHRIENPSNLGFYTLGFLESRKRKFPDAHPGRTPSSISIPQGSKGVGIASVRPYANPLPTSGLKYELNTVRGKMSIASMLNSDENVAFLSVTLPENRSAASFNGQETDRAPAPVSPSESVVKATSSDSIAAWLPLESPILPSLRSPTAFGSFVPMSPPTSSRPHSEPSESVTTPPPDISSRKDFWA